MSTDGKISRRGPRAWQLYLQGIIAAALVTAAVASTSCVVILLGNSDKANAQRAAQLSQGEQIKELTQTLVECTTRPDLRDPPVPLDKVPPGDCYARQQSAQGDLVGEPKGPINTVAVAAAACGAAHPGDVAATLRCTRAAVRVP